MYTITKVYTEEPIKGFSFKENSWKDMPTSSIVKETYTDVGVYIKRGSGLCFGTEGEYTWWSLSPKMGRFEYKVSLIADVGGEAQGISIYRVNLSKNIVLNLIHKDGLYTYKDIGYLSVEDCILQFYLDNTFTRDKDDMSYIFGNRQYKDELVLL